MILDRVGHEYEAGRPLFSGISLKLQEGHSYAVVGPSGSGKSTLLGIMSGDVKPTWGRVTVGETSSSSWVFQNPHGVPGRSALDHVVLPLLARGYERVQAEPQALDLMAEFKLTTVARESFRHLSGGEAQRLMLARAVAAAPDLLLVDEPTAQLDLATASAVNESLQRLVGRGRVVVVATHDPGTKASCTDVLDLADYQSGARS